MVDSYILFYYFIFKYSILHHFKNDPKTKTQTKNKQRIKRI